MKAHGKTAILFEAFARLTSRVFADPRMLSCQVLSKAPHCDDILRRFIIAAPIRPVSFPHKVELTLRCYLVNAAHLALLALGKIALMLSGWRAPAAVLAGKAPLLVVDTFLVLPKVLERRRYTELYMPGLAEEAEQCGSAALLFFRLYGTRDPRLLYRAFCILRDAGVPALTELHLFTWRDWLSLLAHCLAYPLAHWGVIRSLAVFAPETPEAYIRDALIHCLPQCHMTGEGRRLAARRLAALLAPKAATGAHIVSWYENQTVNKAFYFGLREAEKMSGIHIPTTGAQLFLWPDALLNNMADDAEAALGLAPDIVLVNGVQYLPESSTQNYQLGPSLRYGDVFSRGIRKPDAAKPILVLLSYHPEETARILRFVQKADSGFAFVYKFHPATRMQDYAHLLPESPRYVDGSLRTVLEEASLVLGAGSGSLAEAVAMGVPAISVEDALHIPGLGLNYLPDCGEGELWEKAHDPAEMPGIVARLQAYCKKSGRKKAVEKFRARLFTEPTSANIRAAFNLRQGEKGA